MADEIAISVKNVKKDFHLLKHKENSLKRTITQAFKKKEKGADTYHALKGISIDIKKGEFFGVLGRNGSGKSTLLKILAEIYQPSSGSVKVHGKLVPFIELGVGFNNELSGRENVFLNGALLGFSRKEIEERYDKIVEFAELEAFMDQKLKNYSSGMKVRLAFSVAIQADADILLLDEVLAVGDASFQRKCYDYFKSLKANNKTIIFVSHNMGAVREYCDRAILIKDGKVALEGTAEKIADEYLKMFNQPSKGGREKGGDRWGDGRVTFTDVQTSVDEDSVAVELKLQNNSEAIEGLDIGVDLYDSRDNLIGGTQYIRIHPKGFALTEGESKKVTFRFDNHFNTKPFTVNINIKANDGSEVCDFWKKAAGFTSSFGDNEFFPVLLPVKIEE